jgi:Flp pilus assembly protein TadG
MSRLAPVRRLLRAEGGNAAVEMGFLASILVLLISAAAAFGSLIFQFMAVDNAVEAGIAYSLAYVCPPSSASTPPACAFTTSSANIQTVVANSAGLAVTANSPTGFWGCSTSSGITDQAPTCTHTASSCSVTCSNGFPAGYYVTVPAQYSLFGNFMLSLNNFALGSPHTILPNPLNLKTTVRVQ